MNFFYTSSLTKLSETNLDATPIVNPVSTQVPIEPTSNDEGLFNYLDLQVRIHQLGRLEHTKEAD